MTKVQAIKTQTLTGHTDCIYSLQQGSRPDQFFSAGGDGMLVHWDLNKPQTGELIARLPNSVYAMHLLPDKKVLVVGHNYEGIHWLDWENKKELGSLKLGNASIFDIKSAGADLWVAQGDGTVSIVDTNDWLIRKKIVKTNKSARAMAINPMKNEIAIGYSDDFVRVFGLDDYELRHEWIGHQSSVFAVGYTPDFKTLLTGSRDARLKSWIAGDNYAPGREVVAHLYAINNIAFSPNGKHFVTCSLDKSIKVWETGEMKLLKVIDKARHAGHGTSVNKLLWTSYNNALVSASDDRTMSVWDLTFDQEPA
jgi:WD40 repeat protein